MSFGIGRYLSEIADRFSAKEHDVHILTLGSPNDETLIKPHSNVHLHFMKPRKGWYIRDIAHISKLIRKMHPDILHANSIGWMTAGAIVKRFLGVPLIVTFQGAEGRICPMGICLDFSGEVCYAYSFLKCRAHIGSLFRSLNVDLQIKVQGYAWKHVDAVIVVSNFIKQIVISSFRNVKNFFVIPNGVDVNRFKPLDRFKARQALGIPVDKRVILFVGRLVKEKGLTILLKAMPLVLKKFPNTICVVCGSGRDESYFKSQCHDLGIETRVIFKGYVADIVYAYSSADCVVVPSIWPEPFGLVALEAMACARPVVASDVGGIPEIVNEKTGILVRPNDEQSVANAIINIISNRDMQDMLGTMGRTHAVSFYDWNIIAEKILAVYHHE